MMTSRALMVLGTASHVGKSITVAALCRIFHQDGLSVAPFKAQNMALNSFATRAGHEIGRAQAMQSQAAGIEPHVDMNPILLKPSSDIGSQVVLNGKVFGNVTAANFQQLKPQLFTSVVEAYQRLAARYDFIILEGAGSPVEINLKEGDIVNLKMAEAADAACILVADIDRGGVFASLVGTYELLTEKERARFNGFIINKFRGDAALLRPGIEQLESRLNQPCLGIVPYLHNCNIDEEDSVALEDSRRRHNTSVKPGSQLRICVIRLPHISNFSDFSALEAQPEITLFYGRNPQEIRAADLVILPGSKNTISDLCWLYTSGWANAVSDHANSGKPVIGICGGFQMLGRKVHDPFHIEGETDAVSGLALLDVVTLIGREKITRQAQVRLIQPNLIGATEPGPVFEGYEIHMGDTQFGSQARPLFLLKRLGESDSILDGAISDDGRVMGTYLHGLFDSTEGAAALLSHFSRLCGRTQSITIDRSDREQGYDELAAHFRSHLDIKAIYRLVGMVR
ncbi:MAG: cobyric acid synthase [Acidobacteriota bacterium]